MAIASIDSIPVRAAVRFPLRLNIVITAQDRDYQAVTEDVSANGILFSANEIPPIGCQVEFRLKMPAAIMGGADDVLLHCVGRIVRHVITASKKMAAAVIDDYSLKG